MDFASACKKGRFFGNINRGFPPTNLVTSRTSVIIMVFENFFDTRVQRSDKRVEKCILTEIIAQDCCTGAVESMGEEV